MLGLNYTYPIGIEIGTSNIFAVQLEQTRTGHSIRELMHVTVDEQADAESEAGEHLLNLLKKIRNNSNFAGNRAVVSVPSRNVFSFPLRFRLKEGETVEEAIIRESVPHLPFPVEEAIIDYPSIGPATWGDDNEYVAMVVAAQRSGIDLYLQLLTKAGFVAEAIDFRVCSLYRLHSHLFQMSEDPIVLCNVGTTRSQLSVVTKDRILAQLAIDWGIKVLIRKLLANLGLANNQHKGKILLRNIGLTHDTPQEIDADSPLVEVGKKDTLRCVYQILSPFIETLIYELHKIIGYVRSEEQLARFEGMYIYGQGASINSLDRFLEKRLNIPARTVNPLESTSGLDRLISFEDSEVHPFAIAMGLAMRKVKWL